MTAVDAASTAFWLIPTLCVLLVSLAAATEWRHTEHPRTGVAHTLRGLGEFSVAVAHSHRRPMDGAPGTAADPAILAVDAET